MRKNRKYILLTALLLLVVVVVLIGLSEGAIRLRQTLKYGSTVALEETYQKDPVTGLRVPKPGLRTGTISINSLGFRGPEVSDPKPEDSVRIAFLGASTTYCAEASSNEATWPHLVAEGLDAAFPGVAVDYLNAGVPGYVVHRSRSNFKHRVRPLRPDVAVIYHATNDLSWETRLLARQQGLVDDPSHRKPSWLARHSVLWNLAEKNFWVQVAQFRARDTERRLEVDPEALGAHFYTQLTALVRAAKWVAPVVVLPTFSTRIRPGQSPEEQLKAAESALYYVPFMTPEGLIRGFERYNAIIRRVAEEQGAILVEVARAIPGDGEHFNDSVHFTDAGSREMARILVEALRDAEPVRALMAAKAAR